MFRVSLASTVLGVARATKLFVVNGSQVIGGDEFGQLLEVDLESKTTRTVVEGLEPNLERIQPSIVCGQKWYSLPVNFPMGASLATVDLRNNTYEGTRPLSLLLFALKCGKVESELLVVAGTCSPIKFSLVKLDIDTLATESICEFPDVLWRGWLSIFHFSDAELQAAFPVKKSTQSSAKDGEVYRMDIESGEITMHKAVKSCTGCPAVPYHLQRKGGDNNGHGVFSAEEGRMEVSFCEVDYSGSELKVSKCKKDTDNSWWAIGHPPLTCGGDKLNYFAFVCRITDSYQPILGADVDIGDLTDVMHLSGHYAEMQPEYRIGSMTCSPAAVTLI